jgi:leucyl aminopeptidase
MDALSITTTKPKGLFQLVVGIEEGKDHAELSSFSNEQLALLKVDAKPKSCIVLAAEHGSTIAVGIADRKKLKDFGASGVRASAPDQQLVFDLRGYSLDEIEDVALGALIGGKTKSGYKKKHEKPSKMFLLVDEGVKPSLEHVQAIAEDVVMVRELINTPANDLWPAKLAEIVETTSRNPRWKSRSGMRSVLKKSVVAAFLAVGKGSARPPRLVVMRYRGGGKHLGLVGKGITLTPAVYL